MSCHCPRTAFVLSSEVKTPEQVRTDWRNRNFHRKETFEDSRVTPNFVDVVANGTPGKLLVDPAWLGDEHGLIAADSVPVITKSNPNVKIHEVPESEALHIRSWGRGIYSNRYITGLQLGLWYAHPEKAAGIQTRSLPAGRLWIVQGQLPTFTGTTVPLQVILSAAYLIQKSGLTVDPTPGSKQFFVVDPRKLYEAHGMMSVNPTLHHLGADEPDDRNNRLREHPKIKRIFEHINRKAQLDENPPTLVEAVPLTMGTGPSTKENQRLRLGHPELPESAVLDVLDGEGPKGSEEFEEQKREVLDAIERELSDRVSHEHKLKFLTIIQQHYANVEELIRQGIKDVELVLNWRNPNKKPTKYPKGYKRMDNEEKAAFTEMINELTHLGILEEISDTDIGNFVINSYAILKKILPDGQKRWRLIMDCRALNEYLKDVPKQSLDVKAAHRALLIKTGAVIALDIKHAYYLIGMKKEDQQYICLKDPSTNILYKAKRALMGLKTSPLAWLQAINKRMAIAHRAIREAGLSDDVEIVVHVDDVIITGTTPDKAIEALEHVLPALEGVPISYNKTRFYVAGDPFDEILGFSGIVGRTIHPRKSAVEKMKSLVISDIASAHAALGSLKAHSNHFTIKPNDTRIIQDALTKAARKANFNGKKGRSQYHRIKRVPIENTKTVNDALDRVVDQLCTGFTELHNINVPEGHTLEFGVLSDASVHGVGCVLIARAKPDGECFTKVAQPLPFGGGPDDPPTSWRVVDITWKSFTPSQKLNWSVPMKELFGVVHAFRKFESDLQGQSCHVYGDSKVVSFLLTSHKEHIAQMGAELLEYDIHFHHINREENVLSDLLSIIDHDGCNELPSAKVASHQLATGEREPTVTNAKDGKYLVLASTEATRLSGSKSRKKSSCGGDDQPYTENCDPQSSQASDSSSDDSTSNAKSPHISDRMPNLRGRLADLLRHIPVDDEEEAEQERARQLIHSLPLTEDCIDTMIQGASELLENEQCDDWYKEKRLTNLQGYQYDETSRVFTKPVLEFAYRSRTLEEQIEKTKKVSQKTTRRKRRNKTLTQGQIETQDRTVGTFETDDRVVAQVYVPASVRDEVLRQVHIEHGHLGKNLTLRALRLLRLDWPTMTSDASKKVGECLACRYATSSRIVSRYKVGNKPLPDIMAHPLNPTVCVDWGELSWGRGENRHTQIFMVMIDENSGYGAVYPSGDKTTKSAMEIFANDQVFRHPKGWKADGELRSEQMLQFITSRYRLHITPAVAGYSEGQSVAERRIGEIQARLRRLTMGDRAQTKHLISEANAICNTVPQTDEGVTPLEKYLAQRPTNISSHQLNMIYEKIDEADDPDSTNTRPVRKARAAARDSKHANIATRTLFPEEHRFTLIEDAVRKARWQYHSQLRRNVSELPQFRMDDFVLYMEKRNLSSGKTNFLAAGLYQIDAILENHRYSIRYHNATDYRKTVHAKQLCKVDASNPDHAEFQRLAASSEIGAEHALPQEILDSTLDEDGNPTYLVSWLGFSDAVNSYVPIRELARKDGQILFPVFEDYLDGAGPRRNAFNNWCRQGRPAKRKKGRR